jgi:hypothetical protein
MSKEITILGGPVHVSTLVFILLVLGLVIDLRSFACVSPV